MSNRPKRIKAGQIWRQVGGFTFLVSTVKKVEGVTTVSGKTPEGDVVAFTYEAMKDDSQFEFLRVKPMRAVRLELVRPLGNNPDGTVSTWSQTGPVLRTLASATPKLLDAAYNSLIAMNLVGKDLVKEKLSIKGEATSTEGIAYSVVQAEVEKLRKWKPKDGEGKTPYVNLVPASGMIAAIARAASQAFQRRDQGRVSFSSQRIFVREQETALELDNRGVVLQLGLRGGGFGRERFAVRASKGTHWRLLQEICAGRIVHGSCSLQYDKDRRKWYALLSYELPEKVVEVDSTKALVVHRGINNALYCLATTGQSKAISGGKYVAQRRGLQARMRGLRKVSSEERGDGAKGHGRARRYESYNSLENKLAKVTHTFCQQSAAGLAKLAKMWGCGMVVIEDYGGIEPDPDPTLRRILDRFPLHQMKMCIVSRTQGDGLSLRETSSGYISTTCPRCNDCDPLNHVKRTGMFRCRACNFERPADWVAAYWMGSRSGVDMSVWQRRLQQERDLVESIKHANSNGGLNE